MLTACAATASPWSSLASDPMYIPRMTSPSALGFFNDPGSATSPFSPHYTDFAPHGWVGDIRAGREK
jgi:hypothetical protein